MAAALLSKGRGRLWAVHRLDKDTTGVLLLARSEEAHRALSRAFESRSVSKVYRALIRGVPDWTESSCDLSLSPDGDALHRTIVDAHRGKPSRTIFRIVTTFRDFSLVEARPETGRTHQVRVHLAALGFPVACDPLYGDGKPPAPFGDQAGTGGGSLRGAPPPGPDGTARGLRRAAASRQRV
ncbi:MAG: RNA pseudouridine synthase [Candidatus Moduliflexus flocculans]|nr:RNA pseudouridine synthase [Candidatus Moduliflexus flocculans]